MQFCRACRVNPASIRLHDFPLCSKCSSSSIVGVTSSTSQTAITAGMGLFVVAALAGTLYLYSQTHGPSDRQPMRLGFGIEKSRY